MPENIAFDAHQSLSLLRRFVEHVARGETEPRPPTWVLDVQGCPGALAAELPDGPRVLTVNREPRGVADYVRATGVALPLGPETMSAVVVSDALEHVPPARRADLFSEICRVSRGWVLINGPFRAPEVEQAEASVNDLYRAACGKPNPSLADHGQHDLPVLAETRAALEERGFTTTVVPNGSLFSWFLLKSLEVIFQVLPDATTQFEQINDLYVRLWSASDHRRPTYRHLVLAHRDSDRVLELLQDPPPHTGLEFFGPRTEVPQANPDEAQRIRAVATLFERLAVFLREQTAGGTATVEWAYVRRLERIVEEHEEQRRRLEKEVVELRAALAAYESSRLVRLWQRLRGKRGD